MKNSKVIYGVLILLVCFLCTEDLMAQVTLIQHQESGKSGVEKIVFEYTDPSSRSIATKELNVRSQNPYLKTSGLTMKNDRGNLVEVSYNQSIKDEFDQKYLVNKLPDDLNITESIVQNSVRTNKTGYTSLCFTRLGMMSDNIVDVVSESNIQVYNSQGKEIGSIDIPNDIRTTVVTENGKHLAITYGGIIDVNGFYQYNDGFVIYDIESKEELIRREFEPLSIRLNAITCRYNMIFITYQNTNGGERMYNYMIINPKNRKYYFNSFTKTKRMKLKDITEEGMRFSDGFIPYADFELHTF